MIALARLPSRRSMADRRNTIHQCGHFMRCLPSCQQRLLPTSAFFMLYGRCEAGYDEAESSSRGELPMSTASRCAHVALALLAVLPAASAAAEESAGHCYALLVGVREYEASTFTPLKYTENDVETLAGLLREDGRF